MLVLYIAGPYSPKNGRSTEEHIATARQVAIELWEAGHAPICPHLNTAGFENDCSVDWETYLRGDLAILERCDGVVLLPNWIESRGAIMENTAAMRLGKPRWVYPDLPAAVQL